MDFSAVRAEATNSWLIAAFAFVIWILAAHALKKIAYHVIRKIFSPEHKTWIDLMFKTINLPMLLMVILIGATVIQKYVPIGDMAKIQIGYGLKAIIIIIGIVLTERLVKVFMMYLDHRSETAKFSQSVVQGVSSGVVFIIGGLILLGSMGINISPLLATLGVTSLAVALALQGTLANLISGLFLSMDKSIKVGDLIELENGEKGYVEDIGWRSSALRLRSDNIQIIPNSKLVESIVKNYHGPDAKMRIYINCGVHYGSDLRKVEQVALEVARKAVKDMSEVDATFEPWLRFEEFADSSINFCLVMRVVDFLAHFTVKSEMIIRIHERFKEEGIVIPFPLRTLDIQPKHETLLLQLLNRKQDAEISETSHAAVRGENS